MAFDGSTGTFSRTDGTRTGSTVWADAKTAGVKVVSSGHDTHDQDLADGLTNCICKDGQSVTTAVIPFAVGIDMQGTKIDLDDDNDTSITADTDDQIDFEVGGVDVFTLLSNLTSTATITSADAGTSTGPTLSIHRDSASPAANDNIGQILFDGEDSGSARTSYVTIRAVIDDPTNTSETGHLRFQTFQSGTNATRFIVAAGLYSLNATGGDQGADTINASAVYDDSVILTTDYVFDMALDGDIDTSAYDAKAPVPRGNPNGSRVHQPARDYKTRHQGRAISMDNAAQYWKTHRRFPNMPAPGDPRLSIGELAQRVLEVCEEQAVLLEEANQRLKALGG